MAAELRAQPVIYWDIVGMLQNAAVVVEHFGVPRRIVHVQSM